MRAALLLLLPIVGLARPAAAQDASRRCSVPTIDSVFARSGPVFRNCDVDRPARLRRDARPAFTFPPGRSCAIAELVFVVDTAGIPDTLTAMIVETDLPDYAVLLRESLIEWRYRPALRGNAAVRQLVRERRAWEDPNRKVPFVLERPSGQPPAPCR